MPLLHQSTLSISYSPCWTIAETRAFCQSYLVFFVLSLDFMSQFRSAAWLSTEYMHWPHCTGCLTPLSYRCHTSVSIFQRSYSFAKGPRRPRQGRVLVHLPYDACENVEIYGGGSTLVRPKRRKGLPRNWSRVKASCGLVTCRFGSIAWWRVRRTCIWLWQVSCFEFLSDSICWIDAVFDSLC